MPALLGVSGGWPTDFAGVLRIPATDRPWAIQLTRPRINHPLEKGSRLKQRLPLALNR